MVSLKGNLISGWSTVQLPAAKVQEVSASPSGEFSIDFGHNKMVSHGHGTLAPIIPFPIGIWKRFLQFQ